MSFFSELIGKIFGGGGDDFAGMDPDDITMYWRIDHDLDQVDREEQGLAEVLAKYQVSSRRKLEKAKDAFAIRHGQNPAFQQAGIQVQTQIQLGNMHKYHS